MFFQFVEHAQKWKVTDAQKKGVVTYQFYPVNEFSYRIIGLEKPEAVIKWIEIDL